MQILHAHEEQVAQNNARERKLSEDRAANTSLNKQQLNSLKTAQQHSIFSFLYTSKHQ